ncbi:hypothetical protein [Microcella sp.]|uniref:hypothetical protein n=1 Tax=Microcella sp. TaxID=1913979 RepID=UPI002564DBD5|nr:hypothetical protein [Microcella sp.]MBX9470474.1 hypothetical protein [Microcella sp.]MBX9470477.1 hypothetical protein [Microcella sp.]
MPAPKRLAHRASARQTSETLTSTRVIALPAPPRALPLESAAPPSAPSVVDSLAAVDGAA